MKQDARTELLFKATQRLKRFQGHRPYFRRSGQAYGYCFPIPPSGTGGIPGSDNADVHACAVPAHQKGAASRQMAQAGQRLPLHDSLRAGIQAGIPIRIGVNGGSLEKTLLEKYGHPTPEALVESAFSHIRMLEDVGFGDICVSMKSSNVPLMMQAYRLMHERSDYPLHVGVTETGTEYMGTIKSAMGIGGLLCLGIGDTIRVSLTADPVREVVAAKAILKAAGLRKQGVNLISCPTCGRTQIDLIALAQEVEQRLQGLEREITVAVMGCVVNGPGEAHEADYGIAGGKDCGLLFRRGEILGKYPADKLADALVDLILSEK